MIKTLWTVLIFLVMSAQANAGILFEPYVGYAVGSLNLKIADTNPTPALQGYTDGGSINGMGYGGRVGLIFEHFLIVAGEYQAITAKEKLNKSTTQTDWSQKTLFATFGFQAPRGFRLLGSYGFDFQADESSTPTPTHYKGTALKLAVGYHMPMHIAVNLEYSIYKLNDFTQGATSGKIADAYTKLDYSSVMATLSFPFDLFRTGGGSAGGSSGGHRN